MTSSEWTAANVLDVLGDALCRQALVVAAGSPVSAAFLADELDVSPPTVYRRVDSLVDHGLVRAHRRVDADGNHYRAFETAVESVDVTVARDGYEVTVRPRRDLATGFDDLLGEFASGEPGGLFGRSDTADETDTGDGASPL